MDELTLAARGRIRKAVARRQVPCLNPDCGNKNSPYAVACELCGESLKRGIVFSAAQSGTDQKEWLERVQASIAQSHPCQLHDVGATMQDFAYQFDPSINWDKILDRADGELRFRRAQAFGEIAHRIDQHLNDLHIIACHLTFRWRAHLTRGLDPCLLSGIEDHLRLFLTVIDGVNDVHGRLLSQDWGDRKPLELALWRDEEVFITGLLADTFERPHYVVARQEPPENMAQLILEPWRPRIYLSFPITHLKDVADPERARQEIETFRDALRQWAVVFDPYAIKDYDLTYQVPEMKAIAKELGEQTEHRDFRFIDQSELLVAFFPAAVFSRGVDAELRHAKTTGKIIYLCYPQKTGGPFTTSPDYFATSGEDFLGILKAHLEGLDKEED